MQRPTHVAEPRGPPPPLPPEPMPPLQPVHIIDRGGALRGLTYTLPPRFPLVPIRSCSRCGHFRRLLSTCTQCSRESQRLGGPSVVYCSICLNDYAIMFGPMRNGCITCAATDNFDYLNNNTERRIAFIHQRVLEDAHNFFDSNLDAIHRDPMTGVVTPLRNIRMTTTRLEEQSSTALREAAGHNAEDTDDLHSPIQEAAQTNRTTRSRSPRRAQR